MNPCFGLVELALQQAQSLNGDLVAFADDFVDAAVAHHEAHGGLGHIGEQLAHVGDFEKVVVGIFDAVLHNPWNDGDV